jgi:hypothetical protein
VKLALTVVAWLTVIVQIAAVPAWLHAPPQPANVLPPDDALVSVSCVPCTRLSLQSPLCEAADTVHVIPVPVTVPVPVPDEPAATVTTYLGGGAAKLASTLMF